MFALSLTGCCNSAAEADATWYLPWTWFDKAAVQNSAASSPWLTGQKADAAQYAYRVIPADADDCANWWSKVAPVGTECVVKQASGLMTYSDVEVEGQFWPNWSGESNLTLIGVGAKVKCPYGCSFMAAKPSSGAIAPASSTDSSVSGNCALNKDNPAGYSCTPADVLKTKADVTINGNVSSGNSEKTIPAGANLVCNWGCYLHK